jgi:FkbH-like protein
MGSIVTTWAPQGTFHHVGFVVASIRENVQTFAQSLNAEWDGQIIHDPNQAARVAFLRGRNPADPLFELVEPAGEKSPVLSFAQKGGGLHHLCYVVDALDTTLTQCRSQGMIVVRPPLAATAFGGRRIAWVYTRNKLLIEYLERSLTPAEPKKPDLREEIDELMSDGAAMQAVRRLLELGRKESGPASAAFIVARAEKLRGKIPLLEYRLAILRSFTVEPAVPMLRAAAFSYGIDLQVHTGDFNAYAQEMLDPESSLYKFAPNAVVLAARTADLAPDLWQNFTALTPDAINEATQRVCNSLRQWLRAFRERSQAALVVHTLEQPPRPASGLLDQQSLNGQTDAIQTMNRELRRMAGEIPGIYVLDYDALVARHGRLRWQDDRKWLLARMPIAADHLIHLTREWLRFLVPLSGKTVKALVVDLDNTLWGGVIGEDGMTGIKLGPEYPGAAYQELQRAMLDLSHRGILLAICSKNNLDDAMEALEKHPGMLLRTEHFSAMRINWNEKSEGLREIAAELNIGIESLAFLDDNPVEREQVRSTLPDVTVIDLPEDPLQYAPALRECPVFERLTLSSEDQQRTALYSKHRESAQAEQSFQSKEDFYRFLGQEVEIAPVSPSTLARIAQLTQKTNQFNMTTRRYTEQQVSEMSGRSGWQVLSLRVRDRFGDHGLVGVAITRDENEACDIDTFLLSCRVIGRTVETAFLSNLADRAVRRGRTSLRGSFLPTKKNAPARDFYSRHGFELKTQSEGGSSWSLDLKERPIACPEWIKLTDANEGE